MAGTTGAAKPLARWPDSSSGIDAQFSFAAPAAAHAGGDNTDTLRSV